MSCLVGPPAGEWLVDSRRDHISLLRLDVAWIFAAGMGGTDLANGAINIKK